LKEIFEKEDFIFCEYNFFHKTLKTSWMKKVLFLIIK
jgi:hypothetical protein